MLLTRKKNQKQDKDECTCPVQRIHKIEHPILEMNSVRLNLFTQRNSDGTGYLILRGKDIYGRYKRRICDTDIRAIAEYILHTPQCITRLDVCYNEISDFGFHKFLKICLINETSRLTNLNIMNNRLSEGGEYFALFLRKNKSLLYADLGETDITLSSVAFIATALRTDHGENKSLKVLNLNRIVPLFNRYQYETKWLVYHLGFLLEHNRTLVELHLQKNQLCSHDMEYFLRGLRKNKVLSYLDLAFNRLGDHGTELLAKYLSERPPLIFLNLAGNSIGDIGASSLSHGMPFSKIRALDISFNKIRDEGMMEILHTLKKPFYLRCLNIWGNKFGHETCTVIDRMLLSGVLFQHTMDVCLYEVDGTLCAAYYPNPTDKNKHLYYCEVENDTQPILHITRNNNCTTSAYNGLQTDK